MDENVIVISVHITLFTRNFSLLTIEFFLKKMLVKTSFFNFTLVYLLSKNSTFFPIYKKINNLNKLLTILMYVVWKKIFFLLVSRGRVGFLV
jgi:hypothetical protein